MTPTSPTAQQVYLALPATPANVAVVRQALAGVADAMGVEVALTADMKIAVTEACTNAVLHAYEAHGGPLEVLLLADEGALTISVRDRGPGFKPLPAEHDESPLGFGLALIASLADTFSIQGGGDGTEVQMTFEAIPELAGGAPPPPTGQLVDGRTAPADGLVTVEISHGPLVQPVLGRVVSLLAARVDFSIDRLSDVQIISDALAQHADGHTKDGHLAVRIGEEDKSLQLEVGPLVAGGAERLVDATELPGLGKLLPQLADDLQVEAAADAEELLRVRLAEAG